MPQASLFTFQGNRLATNLRCAACELSCNPDLRTNKMSGTGVLKPNFFFAGFAPGLEDDKLGQPLTGSNGRLLRELLATANIASMRECWFSNCLKCAVFDKKPAKKHWLKCSEHFRKELQEVQPKVIVALGAQAFSWLTGAAGATKFYRRSLPCILDESIPVFPLRQPAQLSHCFDQTEVNNLKATMVHDLQWLKQHVTNMLIQNAPPPTDVDYRTITTHEEVVALFAELEKHPVLGFDLETTSLFPREDDRILAAGFSWAPRQGVALPMYARGLLTPNFWEDGYVEREIEPRLRKLLLEKEVFGHNLIQFDQKWTRAKLGIPNLKITYDTQTGHYLCDEERGTHDLEQIGVLYGGMKKWKKEFQPEDTEILCNYLCKDVDALSRIRPVFEGMTTPGEKWLHENVLIPLASELFEAEYAGVRISEQALTDLENILTTKIDASEVRLRQHQAVLSFMFDTNQDFQSESPHHVRAVMQKYLGLKEFKKTDGGEFSTDKESLASYKDNAFVTDLQENRRLRKLRSTYCGQIREALHKGRVHTGFKVHGTVTGRPSSSTPNLLNIPREDTVAKVLEDGTLIKKLFLPDEGQILLQADFNQAELRCLGSISGDPQLCGIYLRGEDAHTSTAAIVYGIPLDKVTKAQRGCAKPVNFGIPYGMSEDGLIAKFVEAGGSEQEARDFLAAHKRKFSLVWRYMEDQAAQVRLHKKQTTYFGRSRRYVQIDNRALRQAYNFPIQSYASDLTLISLIRIAKAIRQMKLKARTVLTVYDSISWSVDPEHFWQLADLAHHVMSTIHFPWMRVPMAADLEAGWSWGDLKKVDLKSRKIG